MSEGFGLAPLRAEGRAAHPDVYDDAHKMTDAWYKRQMEAYMEWSKDFNATKTCVRAHLWMTL